MEGQRYYPDSPLVGDSPSELSLFSEVKRWLDAYFRRKRPTVDFPLALEGTPFRQEVWALLRQIPYGETVTYGELAAEIAKRRCRAKFSAQAVGQAVGRNPISIIVPCHRVVGASHSLTGYAGGVERKRLLLDLEGIAL